METHRLDCVDRDVQLVAQYLSAKMQGRLRGDSPADDFFAAHWEGSTDSNSGPLRSPPVPSIFTGWQGAVLEADACYALLQMHLPQVPARVGGAFVTRSVMEESMILTMNYVRILAQVCRRRL
jgi:hypothetical protein